MTSDGGGSTMLRMCIRRTAASHAASNRNVMPSGQADSFTEAFTLANMAGLDRFAQVTDVFVEALFFGHADVTRPRQINLHLVDDSRRAAAHDQHPVGQERRFTDAMGDENDGLAIGLPDPE